MRISRTIPAITALVLPLCLVVSGASYASCGSGNRTALGSAECLDGGWNNKKGFMGWKSSTFWAQNKCPDWGKTVAKVDISKATDKTWHLTTGDSRSGSHGSAHVSGVYCCSDLSHLCNKSDVLTSSGCTAKFQDSPAFTSGTCSSPSATVSGENCAITATCNTDIGGGTLVTGSFEESITIHYTKADEVQYCIGKLYHPDDGC